MTFPKTFAHLSWALAGLLASQAMAADPAAPKTRAQVKAERDEAIRKGEMMGTSEVEQSADACVQERPMKPAALDIVVQGVRR